MKVDSKKRNGPTRTIRDADGVEELRTAVKGGISSARMVIADPEASVTVAVPDASERLRVVWSQGEPRSGVRRGSAQRRTAFRTGHPQRADAGGGLVSACIPLVDQALRLGVLEVIARERALEDRWGALEAIANQLAVHLRSLREHEALRRRVDQGLAWVAHEFRAPVLAVRAVLEGLVNDGPSPSDIPILRSSIREMDQLARMSEGLLGWAVGARPMALATVDLVRIVEEAVASCTLDSTTPIVILGPPHAFVRGDVDHLRVAVANLVRNALAVSSFGSKVEIEIENEHTSVVVKVSDHGPGVMGHERDVIFDPFVRGSASSPARSGNGLGLFITRRIVEAHAGRIWVESEGGGATFCVQLLAGEETTRCAC